MPRFAVLLSLLLTASSLLLGQSHPPFQDDFPAEEFVQRRARVFDAIGKDALAIVQGAAGVDGFKVFRQSNEFYYLTGLESPHAYLRARWAEPQGHAVSGPPERGAGTQHRRQVVGRGRRRRAAPDRRRGGRARRAPVAADLRRDAPAAAPGALRAIQPGRRRGAEPRRTARAPGRRGRRSVGRAAVARGALRRPPRRSLPGARTTRPDAGARRAPLREEPARDCPHPQGLGAGRPRPARGDEGHAAGRARVPGGRRRPLHLPGERRPLRGLQPDRGRRQQCLDGPLLAQSRPAEDRRHGADGLRTGPALLHERRDPHVAGERHAHGRAAHAGSIHPRLPGRLLQAHQARCDARRGAGAGPARHGAGAGPNDLRQRPASQGGRGDAVVRRSPPASGGHDGARPWADLGSEVRTGRGLHRRPHDVDRRRATLRSDGRHHRRDRRTASRTSPRRSPARPRRSKR